MVALTIHPLSFFITSNLSHQLSILEVCIAIDSHKYLGCLVESKTWNTSGFDDWMGFVRVVVDTNPAISFINHSLEDFKSCLVQHLALDSWSVSITIRAPRLAICANSSSKVDDEHVSRSFGLVEGGYKLLRICEFLNVGHI